MAPFTEWGTWPHPHIPLIHLYRILAQQCSWVPEGTRKCWNTKLFWLRSGIWMGQVRWYSIFTRHLALPDALWQEKKMQMKNTAALEYIPVYFKMCYLLEHNMRWYIGTTGVQSRKNWERERSFKAGNVLNLKRQKYHLDTWRKWESNPGITKLERGGWAWDRHGQQGKRGWIKARQPNYKLGCEK